MKRILTSVAGVAVAAVASGGLLAGFAGSAHAAAKPPWEPDPSSVGGLTFYNASGAKITGGSTTAAPIAAYVEGNSTVRSGDTKATLYGYLPVKGEVPGKWSGEQLSSSTAYPNSGAPGSLKTAKLPLVTGAAGDETVAQLATDYPNTDTTSDGYSGIYQLRLVTSGPGESATVTYDSADIQISGSKWSVVYSGLATVTVTKTTTTLKASKVTIKKGKKLALTITEKPAVAGKVAVYDGSKKIGTVTVKKGKKASFSTKKLKVGKHRLTAKFTPSSSAYKSSTSKVVKVKVTK